MKCFKKLINKIANRKIFSIPSVEYSEDLTSVATSFVNSEEIIFIEAESERTYCSMKRAYYPLDLMDFDYRYFKSNSEEKVALWIIKYL